MTEWRVMKTNMAKYQRYTVAKSEQRKRLVVILGSRPMKNHQSACQYCTADVQLIIFVLTLPISNTDMFLSSYANQARR